MKASIPIELTSRRQWLRWNLNREGRKVPIALDGTAGSSTDSTTWCSFDRVSRHDRIAFVIDKADPYTGVDLDNCFKNDGSLRNWAAEVIDKFRGVAYCEISPSGAGLKLTTIGRKPQHSRCQHKFGDDKNQLECYDHARFWTVTGNVFDGMTTIGDGQDAVTWLCNKYLNRAPRESVNNVRRSASDVIDRASKYLATMDPAIQGSGGSNACFRAACAMVLGFELPTKDAYRLLLNEYNDRCDPPWSEKELWHKIESAAKQGGERGHLLNDGQSTGNPGIAGSFSGSPANHSFLRDETKRTDNAMSVMFADRYHDVLRYVPRWKKWLWWDDKRWANDDNVGVHQCGKRFADSLWRELGDLVTILDRDEYGVIRTFVKSANRKGNIDAFIELARVDHGVVVDYRMLDKQATFFNVQNGTLDLATGELREHRQSDLITQIADVAFDPEAMAGKWEETMRFVFDDDEHLIRYFQQLLGYGLLGDAPEQILPIWYGAGNNGKSTVWNTLHSILGDYATTAPQDLILPARHENSHDRAELFGKRFVMVAEPEENRRLAESQVKMLTGGDEISACRKYENPFTFRPTHLLCVATNHKPKIAGTDTGIWRRVKLVPFLVDLADRTNPREGFHNWLAKNEASGILNWLLAGYRDWRKNGFCEPEAVTNATREYRQAEDEIEQFLANYCVLGDDQQAYAGELHKLFEKEGYRMWRNRFFQNLMDRFSWTKTTHGKVFFGVGIPDAQL